MAVSFRLLEKMRATYVYPNRNIKNEMNNMNKEKALFGEHKLIDDFAMDDLSISDENKSFLPKA